MIREACIEDAMELIEIQKKCIAGTEIMVTTVNKPDFFLRSSLYVDSKTFILVDDEYGKIKGTLSAAIKNAELNGRKIRQGYIYQLFTNPSFRKQGVARQLLQHVDNYMLEKKADLATLLILEKNIPSMKLFETEGFYKEHTFANPYIEIYKTMKLKQDDFRVSKMHIEDLEAVCKLLNKMWYGSGLYVKYTPQLLKEEIERIPGLRYDSIYLLWKDNKLCSCIALWNWCYITKVTVKKLSCKFSFYRHALNFLGLFLNIPKIVGPGDEMKQACLYFYGYTEIEYFTKLLIYINNDLKHKSISEICLLCEMNDAINKTLKKFISVNIGSQLYVRKFNQDIDDFTDKIWINGSDI